MKTIPESQERLDLDCYRKLLRYPPSTSDPAAHLVWLRLVSQVLVGLEAWAPNFATALACELRSLDGFRAFCESGDYERTYIDGVPHAQNFLRWFLEEPSPLWLKDLARCETWATLKRGGIPVKRGADLKSLLGIQSRAGKEFVIVSHDVLTTIQTILGYSDTSMSRAGKLLWLLGAPPVHSVIEAQPQTGIVVFPVVDGEVELCYVPAEQ